jgi:hypothetical protein
MLCEGCCKPLLPGQSLRLDLDGVAWHDRCFHEAYLRDEDLATDAQDDVWDVVVYPPGEQDPDHYVGVASCRGSMEMVQFKTDAPAASKVEKLLPYVTHRTTARVGLFAVMPVDQSEGDAPWSSLKRF